MILNYIDMLKTIISILVNWLLFVLIKQKFVVLKGSYSLLWYENAAVSPRKNFFHY